MKLTYDDKIRLANIWLAARLGVIRERQWVERERQRIKAKIICERMARMAEEDVQ